MPASQEEIDLHFPKGGIDVSRRAHQQPWREGPRRPDGTPTRIYTTPEAINVRGFDALTKRTRGGSRPALAHYAPDAVIAGWHIQHLASLAAVKTLGTPVQASLLGRVVKVVAVSQGRVFTLEPNDTRTAITITEATNASSTTPPLSFSGVMASTPLNQKLWMSDGTRYRVYSVFDPDNTVSDWTHSAGTSMPRDSAGNGARLLETYFGAVVAAGFLRDGSNFYMSRVGDPTDWDTSPAVVDDPTHAVSGSLSRVGIIGDVITALCSYSDDTLLFGCQHSIRILQGHPLAGGDVDLVTDAIGVAFGRAFCKDPRGTWYFMANTGEIYGMPHGGRPEKVSGAISPIVELIDTGDNVIQMQWDEANKGFVVFISNSTDPTRPAVHYFFERDLDCWTKLVFANGFHNPIASCVLDGNTVEDRVVLLGSRTGHINCFDPEATTDLGTAIESEVWIGPILTKDFDEVTLYQIQAVLAEGSGEVNWAIHTGRTAEEALASDPARESDPDIPWTGGRNPSDLIMQSGHAIFVKLWSTNQWAMEGIRATLSSNLSMIRRRGA